MNDTNISNWTVDRYYHSFIEYAPDVIFWSPSGLHLLHLYQVRPFGNHSIEIINQYEDNLLEIYHVAQQLDACLIYRALSPLCYINSNSNYQDIRSTYLKHEGINKEHNDNDELDEAAYEHFISFCIKHNPNIDNIEEICRQWTFVNEGGIAYQNKLIKQFVNNAQHKRFAEFNNVFYYDRFNVFHTDPRVCKSEAQDTVHWSPSYGADAMYFTNFIYICSLDL